MKAIRINIFDQQLADLEKEQKENGLSRSAIVRAALSKYFKSGKCKCETAMLDQNYEKRSGKEFYMRWDKRKGHAR